MISRSPFFRKSNSKSIFAIDDPVSNPIVNDSIRKMESFGISRAGAEMRIYCPAEIFVVSVYGEPPVYPWTYPYDRSGVAVEDPAPEIEIEIDLFGFQLRAKDDPVNVSTKFARLELSSPRKEPRSKRASERGPAGRA
jgi:hypothetical protein